MEIKAIALKSNNLSCLEENMQKEWLITNGIGGYASSTVFGINTRKYHGLLVSALKPPGSRTVLLEKLDEDIIVNNEIFRFGSNEFKNTIFPKGFQYLKQFSINPFPQFIYEKSNVEFKKTIFMPSKRNAVVTIYDIFNNNSSTAIVKIFPLLNCRNFHKVTNNQLNPIKYYQNQTNNKAILSFPDSCTNLILFSTQGKFIKKTNWINQIHYRQEKLRGESHIDDCLQPGFFELKIKPKTSKKTCIIAISENNKKTSLDLIKKIGSTNKDIFEKLNDELIENQKILNDFYSSHKQIPENNWLNWLLLAGKNLVVTDKKNNIHILAGYFWFGPWGRDTFISLPGLLLVTKRFNVAKKILFNFSLLIRHGLIPNFQKDQKEDVAYNTVDASLWYLNAILQFLKYTGDFDFVRQKLWNKILEIVGSFKNGTDFGIKMDHDGLLMHGPQLTWMDAVADGKAITPRSGKAVEIQSLWYNALKITELLAKKFREKNIAKKYSEIAKKTKKSFNRKFWNKKRNCLFDVIDNNKSDSSIRPNQIFSLALDFIILNKNRGKAVVDMVSSKLLTPYGLRTLEKDDLIYIGKYVGDRKKRDKAYHNGTVWPWLLGAFLTASIKLNQLEKNQIGNQKEFLRPLFEKHLLHAGLGNISEIFDGDSPHKARGCISQAWSIAEPLRAYIENIMNIKPKYNHILS
jgi:predicted glycogen debranching enzyme